jgi:hypothetical protein
MSTLTFSTALQLSFVLTTTKLSVSGTPVCPPTTSERLSGSFISPPGYGNGPSSSVGSTTQLPEVVAVVVDEDDELLDVDDDEDDEVSSFLHAPNNAGPAAAATANALKRLFRSILL